MDIKVNPYKPHSHDFLVRLAVAVLDGKAMVNWALDSDMEEIAFLPVQQATPEQLAQVRAQCGGLYFFATMQWALPYAVRGIPVFHTVEPLSADEVQRFTDLYKDEKAKRIANREIDPK